MVVQKAVNAREKVNQLCLLTVVQTYKIIGYWKCVCQSKEAREKGQIQVRVTYFLSSISITGIHEQA